MRSTLDFLLSWVGDAPRVPCDDVDAMVCAQTRLGTTERNTKNTETADSLPVTGSTADCADSRTKAVARRTPRHHRSIVMPRSKAVTRHRTPNTAVPQHSGSPAPRFSGSRSQSRRPDVPQSPCRALAHPRPRALALSGSPSPGLLTGCSSARRSQCSTDPLAPSGLP